MHTQKFRTLNEVDPSAYQGIEARALGPASGPTTRPLTERVEALEMQVQNLQMRLMQLEEKVG